MNVHAISVLFAVAAALDGLLGLLTLVGWRFFFDLFGIPWPGHPALIQLVAVLILVVSLMLASVASDPARNVNLIVFGILVKAGFCIVVFANWATIGIPLILVLFAGSDLGFVVLFILSLVALKRPTPIGIDTGVQ